MYSRLYIHVPFCQSKCGYCAFASAPPSPEELSEYPELLIRELRSRPPASEPLQSIYFGGGTPSLLLPEQITVLLGQIADCVGISPQAEITLEANPGTVTFSSLSAFRAGGINRLSLGIQSFDNRLLTTLGRIHTSEQAYRAFQEARTAGFTNISIDLMHSLPGQSLEQWRKELQRALALNPEHISVYGLTVEEGTPFASVYPPDSPTLADEDLSADMYELTDELLTGAGFDHYEIANFCRPGHASRHNCGYWNRDGYLGLGVAAHSFFKVGYGLRCANDTDLESYHQRIHSGKISPIDGEHLTMKEAMAEFLFLGLRLSAGVSITRFRQEFGQTIQSVYSTEMETLITRELLSQSGTILSLTPRGRLLSNQVFSCLL